MSIKGRIARWRYWRQMAKIDRHCRKHGHNDEGCWSMFGEMGDHCMRCGRILWTHQWGDALDPPIYQAPTRAVESNWR